MEAVPQSARRFVVARLRDPVSTDAALIRRVHCSTKVPTLPPVRAALDAAFAKAAEDAQVEASTVLARLKAIAFADANALTQHRRAACRYCHGREHRYHYTPNEYKRAVVQWEEASARTRGEHPDQSGGGIGYTRKAEPHPDCPECFGDGVAFVHLVDTRRLRGDARPLYAGVKETDKGIEIKVHDQFAALTLLARIEGLLAEKPPAPEEPIATAQRVRAYLVAMDATVPRAA